MSTIEYRETIDYVFCINKHIDRLMEAYTRIDPRDPTAGLRHVYVALRGLILMSAPFVNGWEYMLDELNASLKNPKNAWITIDNIIIKILTKLDEIGLLTRKRPLEQGEYEGAGTE